MLFLKVEFALLWATYIASKELQPKNALFPIDVTLADISTSVSFSQFLNASLPILITVSGILTSSKFIHPENALSLISFVPPKSTLIKFELVQLAFMICYKESLLF